MHLSQSRRIAVYLNATVSVPISFERWPSPARRELKQKRPEGNSDSAVAGQVHGCVGQPPSQQPSSALIRTTFASPAWVTCSIRIEPSPARTSLPLMLLSTNARDIL